MTNYTDNTGVVNFLDQPVIVWSGSFTEAAINDGTVTGSRVATLSGDTFVNAGGTLATPTHYILTGVPAGMAANVAVSVGGDAVTVTLTGAATDHLNIHDVSNLTLTFVDGVFTNTPLTANVTDPSNALGAIDFRDPGTASIAYSAAVFNENVLNNGTISNTLTLTLTGDTAFQDTDADDILDIGTEVLVNNLPIGLSAAITLSVTDTVATITLSGTAAAHTTPDSINNLEIVLQDTAFTLLPASSVTNATKSDLAITYTNASSGTLTYGSSTFSESVTNNGTISSSLVVTLGGGGIFAPTLTAGTHVTFLNVPTGLTGVVTRNSDTQATLTLTGTAAAHANVNDIANLIVMFGDSAFTGVQAANVTNATKSDIVVDYRDITLGYDVTTFSEVIANDGTSTTTAVATLTGDTFTQSTGAFTAGVHYSTVAVPTGMTLTITATSSTTATVALTGSATANLTNPVDVTALTITWLNPAFTAAPAANITGYAKNDFIFDFLDQPSIVYAGSFTETAVNNGSLLGSSRTATLTGDTYETSIVDGTTFTENTHFTITGKPAGLTAVLTKTS